MPSAARSPTSILVASDSTVDAVLVRTLLEDEFGEIALSVNPARAAADFHAHQPAVLLLAFRQLQHGEDFYLGLYRRGEGQPLHRHRAVILCTREEVRHAYELCRRGLFDDYVLFWPVNDDVTRLQLSVRHALEALQMAPADSEPSASRALQVTAPRPAAALAVAAVDGLALPARAGIFVVDDDEFQRQLTAQILESEGYRTYAAAGGSEALGLLSRGGADLVLLDYLMPDMNGLEVLGRLKSDATLAPIPVIMLTGNSERGVVMDSRRLGAADFLVKPFDRQTLLAKIARVLHRPAQPAAAGG